MDNPHAINIHCDGAMDYDSKQTGGNGFVIQFPDSFNLDPIFKSIRNDHQGIHRLEMISIIEAMQELLAFGKLNRGMLRKAAGVCIYTDRFSVTDEELVNPYRVQEYRKNDWKNHEGKPIKDKDLLDKIDKIRKKISQETGGRIEIKYKREKHNKIADKLSRIGKRSSVVSKRIIKKNRNVSMRRFEGQEINYATLSSGSILSVRVYAWEKVQNQFEVVAEVTDGENFEKKIKIYVDSLMKSKFHRQHNYQIKIDKVFSYHVSLDSFQEKV